MLQTPERFKAPQLKNVRRLVGVVTELLAPGNFQLSTFNLQP
jgi:hypothetical protein